MNFPFSMTVEVWRTPPRNRFGDTDRTLHHSESGCVMAPRYSSDVTDNQNRTIVGFTLFAPPDADILADDQIKTPDQQTYDTVGEAASWASPFTGWQAGVEVALRRVT